MIPLEELMGWNKTIERDDRDPVITTVVPFEMWRKKNFTVS